MPAHASEQKHYHDFSEQYFYILNGTATFEIEKEVLKVNKGEGVHVYPHVNHQIKNDHSSHL